jgi:CRISPR-associated protein Csd2
MIHTDPSKRHDFVLIFDVTDGNPNGDPDGGNMPRTDPETLQGLVTDVALKRKVRNFVALASQEMDEAEQTRYKIFVEHRGVLNEQIKRAYVEQGIPTGQVVNEEVDKNLLPKLRDVASSLPEGFSFEDSDDDSESAVLTYTGELSSEELKAALDEIEDLDRSVKKFLNDIAKKAGKPEKSRANEDKARRWMCGNFFDVRMFGAVMSTGLNAGQVRGPMQLTFARSIDPVLARDVTITRVAITKSEDAKRKETEIGRKALIHYGLYAGHGFYSPHLANLGTDHAVTSKDLELVWQALEMMWGLDHSASRGQMECKGLYVFSHESKLGNAAAHKLFDLIQIEKIGGSPRTFGEYKDAIKFPEVEVGKAISLETQGFKGITLTRLV